MNWKRYAIATIAVFAFIFLYRWIVHGVLLTDYYKQTSQVWRNFAEMEANMPIHMLLRFLFAAWVSFVFTQLFPSAGLANGLRYGLYFGVIIGFITGSWYLHLPVPLQLGWSWFASGIGEGLGSGLILGAIYKK